MGCACGSVFVAWYSTPQLHRNSRPRMLLSTCTDNNVSSGRSCPSKAQGCPGNLFQRLHCAQAFSVVLGLEQGKDMQLLINCVKVSTVSRSVLFVNHSESQPPRRVKMLSVARDVELAGRKCTPLLQVANQNDRKVCQSEDRKCTTCLT